MVGFTFALIISACFINISNGQCDLSNVELQGVNLNQGNLQRTSTSEACNQICDLTIDCEGFTYYKTESKSCLLKYSKTRLKLLFSA